MKLKWIKWDFDAAIAGMIGLTPQERGIYCTLLFLLYSRDGKVPNDNAFLRPALGCHGHTWKVVRDKLIAKGKIWITADGMIHAKRVDEALAEAQTFSENDVKTSSKAMQKSKKINEINGKKYTSTTTSTYILPFSVTPSDQIQPSEELLKHEHSKRPTPKPNGGSLATAPLGSALASPPCAVPSVKEEPPDKPVHELSAAEVIERRRRKAQPPNETSAAQLKAELMAGLE